MQSLARASPDDLCIKDLNLTSWPNEFHDFLSSADFFHNQLFSTSFRKTIRVSNSLDLDQDGHFVEIDLSPNYLQWLSADDKSRR